MSVTTSRRGDLLRWLRRREAHSGLTAVEIADVSGIYVGPGRYDRCIADLKALAYQGTVWRKPGRPARWAA